VRRCGDFTGFEAVTWPFDLDWRGIKTVKSIGVGVKDVTSLKASVQYKHTGGTTFDQSTEILCNQEGFAFPVVSGTDFKLRLTGTFGAAGKINYITAGVTLDDKRNSV
jgi:hypothetical protein